MQTHIKHLGLENFRVFKERTDFDFAPITILTGTNSSGKSSLINAMEILNYGTASTKDDGINLFNDLWYKSSGVSRSEFSAFSILPTAINRRFGGFASLKHFDKVNDSMTMYKNCLLPYGNEMVEVSVSYAHAANDAKVGLLQKIEIKIAGTDVLLCVLGNFDGTVLGFVNYPYFLKRLRAFANNEDDEAFIKDHTIAMVDEDESNVALMELASDKIRERLKAFFESEKPYFRIQGPDFAIGGFQDFDEDASARYIDKYHRDLMDYCKKLQTVEFASAIAETDNLDKFKLESQVLFLEDLWLVIRENAESIGNRELDDFATAVCHPIGSFRTGRTTANVANYYEKILEKFKVKAVKNKEYEAVIKFMFTDFIWGRINDTLKNLEPKKMDFVPASKIQPERVYIDFDKHKSLTILKSLNDILIKASKYKNDKVTEFFKHHLKRLGQKFSFHIEDGNDASSSMVYLNNGGHKTLLVDAGFGVAQFLHVLAQVIISGYPVYSRYRDSGAEANGIDWDEYFGHSTRVGSILVIEEPEAHLHPALQSNLADLFVEAAKTFGIQFIIETHSEYLIRKLQYLTAKGEIKPEDTAIYYFYPPDNVPPGEPQVKRIDIDEDGYLSADFGTGFFDESDKLAMSLWNHNKSQKN